MYSARDTPKGVGFPIRKSPDQSLLAAPQGLSQRATSFIASRCQGIHQMPFSRLRITSMRRDKPKPHGRSFNSRSKHDLQGSSTTPGTVGDRTHIHDEKELRATLAVNPGAGGAGAYRPWKTSWIPPPPSRDGGGERTRTDDLLLAKQVLSQLSYAPDVRELPVGGPG